MGTNTANTATNTARTPQRDGRGLFTKGNTVAVGNAGGRPPMAPGAKDIQRELRRIASDGAPRVIAKMLQLADEGDVQAARLALQYAAGTPGTQTSIAVEGLAELPPDQAVARINDLAATGEFTAEQAHAAIAIQRARMDVAVLRPLRQLFQALQRNAPGDEIVALLGRIDLGRVIEGVAVGVTGQAQPQLRHAVTEAPADDGSAADAEE